MMLNEEEKAKLERKMRIAIFSPNREMEGNEMKKVEASTFRLSRMELTLLEIMVAKELDLVFWM